MKPRIKNYIIKLAFLKLIRKLRLCAIFWKFILALLVIISLILIYYKNIKENNDSTASVRGCEVTSEQKVHLFNLLKQVLKILDKLDITYFLCYSSLWGAVQESGPLPWDANAELCILNNNLVNYDEASIHRTFHRQNLSLEYSSSEGEYIVRYARKNGPLSQVKLTVFEADGRVDKMFRRVGWKRRLLPPNCDAQPDLQCFPSHLINNPLPIKSFGPLSIPGPREDMDLLKFHYPDTWWKPLKPKCLKVP